MSDPVGQVLTAEAGKSKPFHLFRRGGRRFGVEAGARWGRLALLESMSFEFHCWCVLRVLPAWGRLLACAAASFLVSSVLLARSAAALEPAGAGGRAPSDEPAPMCAPDGASVVAADDIPEVDRGHFEVLPCEAQLLLAGFRPDAPEPGSKSVSLHGGEPPQPAQHAAPVRPRNEGARALVPLFPARAEPHVGEFSTFEGLSARAGHARSVFRPPLALV